MSMARPSGVRLTRQRRSAVTRDRVARVALELFNEQGYLPVTTNAIAEACGISTGSFYYHFRNREDVLWYLFLRVEAEVRGLLIEVPFRDTGLALLRRQLSGVTGFLTDYRFFFPDQAAVLRRDERVATAFLRLQTEVLEAMTRQLAGWLRPAQQGGRVVVPDPAALARALWLMVTSWVTFLQVRGEPVTPETVAGVVPAALSLLDPFVPL